MEPSIGEVWAYRARGVDPLSPVRVVRLGQRKPPRVLVHFEAHDMEGLEDWVPPGRLKVPWAQVKEFIAEETNWKAVRERGPGRDSVELASVEAILDYLVDPTIAEVDYRHGVLRIRASAELSAMTDLSVQELTGHELSFASGDEIITPWPVALHAAKTIARKWPDQVLAKVDAEERDFQHTLIHGFSWSRDREFRDVDSDVSIAREVDEGGYRQSREMRRQWAGADALRRNDELIELRKEIRRVGQVAEEAIEMLRDRGHKTEAEQLALRLGQTVEMLRIHKE